MAAAHQVKPLYYGVGLRPAATRTTQWGFAVGGGIKLNAPMIGQGDYFQAQVNYTQGAVKYIFQATQANWLYRQGDSAAVGNVLDGVYGGYARPDSERRRADHCMERQRGLRALLEPALENLALRWLCSGQL